MIQKYLLSIFLFFFSVFSYSAENMEIFLPRGTPLFHTTEVSGVPAAYVPHDTLAAIQETSVSNFKIGALNKNTRIVKVVYPGAPKACWTFDDIRLQVDPDTQKVSFQFLPYLLPMLSGIFCIAGAFLLLYLFLRGKNKRFQEYLPYGVIVLLQNGIMLYLIGATANIMMVAIDDLYYFQIAEDLMKLDFSGPWMYTIGLPLFYAPLVWLYHADSFWDIRIPFYVFNSMAVMPFLLCMAYLALKKISSARSALFVILLWIVMILFYHHRYYYVGSDTALDSYLMKSFPRLPSLTFSYSYFELLVLLGYNAVSDTLSCALVFSCIAAALSMKPTTRNLALFAALYALSCLVRINNILFVPLLAFSLYLRYADNLRNLRQWIRFLLTGAVPFCLVFSSQLIVNTIQFGNPLTFPYSLHSYQNITRGFLFEMLPFGIRFLGINNFAYLAIGSLSLFFIHNRKNRVILSLWTLPLVFFFFGYPVVFSNGTRFILPAFAGFVAALVLADVWSGPLSEKIRCGAVLLSSVFLTAPAAAGKMENYLPWDWASCGMTPQMAIGIQIAVIAVSILILLSFLLDLRTKKEEPDRKRIVLIMIFLVLFLILFHWGNPYAVAVLMLCAFLRACYDAVILIREKLRTAPAECASADAEST